jgi:hypothetical protein
MEMSQIHPDIVYTTLSSKPGRSERRSALQRIHEICAKRYQNGVTDFSFSAVGKECESEGILKARALYNASSADYKVLIDAWSVYGAGHHAAAGDEKAAMENESRASKRRNLFLSQISDPTIRAEVENLIDERDRLRIQLNLAEVEKSVLSLKVAQKAVLEQAPVKLPRGRPLKNISEWILKPGDLSALKSSILPEFIKRQGWSLGPQGEIRNALGDTLYEPGYLQGMRKLLANLKDGG